MLRQASGDAICVRRSDEPNGAGRGDGDGQHVPGTTYQTRIDTEDLAIIGDEPVASGGDGLGPSPYEFLLAALGHCTVLTILLYARRKGVAARMACRFAPPRAAGRRRQIDGELVKKKVERIIQEIAMDGQSGR